MKISTSRAFPAGCDDVFAILCDQSFQESLTGKPGGSAAIANRGDRTVITSVRVFATAGMPDVARTFIGDTLRLAEVQDWGPARSDGARTGTLTLTVEGAPLRLDGTLALTPTATGCTQSVTADLRAKVPLVGGRIEQAAGPVVQRAIHDEYDLIAERLGG